MSASTHCWQKRPGAYGSEADFRLLTGDAASRVSTSATRCSPGRKRSAVPFVRATFPRASSIVDQRLILVNLLIKLGVAAAVSSALVRSLEFKKLLFREERSTAQKIYLVLWFGIPIALGVWIRFIQKSFSAGDLSFETTLLLGELAGG